jgi:mannose-6-phosphate isomerase class I
MLEPALMKLTPAAVTKPWGLVHESAERITGIGAAIGELWLASAQTGPGNYSNTVARPALKRSLADAMEELRGDEAALRDLIGPTPLQHLQDNPHRGKTEAWYIRRAEGRTGVVAGPRTQQQADRLQDIIMNEGLAPHPEQWSEEVRELFGIIEPLEGGEMFLTPAGALHTMFAIGRESVLIMDEIQQGYGEALVPTLTKILMVQDNLLSVQVHPGDRTVAKQAEGELDIEQDLQDNPTVRVYDFGRRPGEYPKLGFKLVDPDNGLRRVPPVTVERDGWTHEVLVADPHFAKARLTIPYGRAADLGPHCGSYHVLHCLKGRVMLHAREDELALSRGETVLVPACMEDGLKLTGEEDSTVFDDALPQVPALTEFLVKHGAAEARVQALLDPPPARE